MAKKPAKDRRKRPLTEAEAKLWSKVARTTRPIAKARPPSADEVEEAGEDEPAGSPAPSGGEPRPAAPARAPAHTPPLARLDRRELRQLASRRGDVEARIDLHGMRQREAHAALMAFLQRARREGHRYALVITGKGSGAKGGEDAPFGSEETGVLRRAVPHWLEEPAFRALIVGYGPAHARHGGEGALYVRLRRERD